MSHFSVLVIGDDVDHQLTPFHEFESTGVNNEFVTDVDQTEEARADYEIRKDDPNYPDFKTFVEKRYNRRTVPIGEKPDLEGEHKYGYAMLDEKGEIIKVISRTNENAKWDWYVVGGRWSGALLTNCGRRVNAAEKGEIDFTKMQAEADDEVRKIYQKAGYNPSMSWRPWEELVKDQSFLDTDERREAYWSQTDLGLVKENCKKAAEASGEHWSGFGYNYDEFLGNTEDEYVEKYSTRGLDIYAMVKDRQWVAKGEMGWFGMSNDDMTNQEWNIRLWEEIQKLPDDAVLTVVDCHI